MNLINKIKALVTSLFQYMMQNKKLWLLPAFLIFILLNFVFSEHGIINRIGLELEKDDFTERIKIERLKTDSLKQRVVTLTFDSLEIERIAREYYGMLKAGEVLYIYKKTETQEK